MFSEHGNIDHSLQIYLKKILESVQSDLIFRIIKGNEFESLVSLFVAIVVIAMVCRGTHLVKWSMEIYIVVTLSYN